MRGASTIAAVRMKRLPRQHRIAHLRALIRQALAPSIRRFELVALLREEVADQSSERRVP
jgi:hypothetical protein